MKQLLLITLALVPWLLTAQNTSGEITYRETIQIRIEMPDADEALKKMIPPSQSITRMLVFNEAAARYKDAGAKDEGDLEVSNNDDGREFKFVMKRPENTLYTDLDENTTINRREFFGRDFLVTGNARECQWKLTGEKKMIGDYECQKAVLQDTSEQVVAWFTPQIPVQAGPSHFGMLPGLILEIDIDNGNRSLQPEYTHELRTGYFLYDQFSFTSFFANLTGTYTTDKITNATVIDSLLRRSVTPVNVEREMALRGSLQYGMPIRPLHIKFRVQLNSGITQRILFVNTMRNDVRDVRNGLDFSLGNRKKDKVDALAAVVPGGCGKQN